MTKKIELTREQLYEKVWTTPMSKLAKELGMSDVGLAKLCNRLTIPKPGLGYWARIAHGQKVPRPPLPQGSVPQPQPITFVVHEPVQESLPNDIEDFRKSDLVRIRGLTIQPNRTQLDRIKKLLFGELRDKKPERYAPWVGWMIMGRHWMPRINVAKENWNRAVNLVISIIAAADACGYRLEQDEHGKYVIAVHESRILIAIREKAKQTPYTPPPPEKDEFRPIGELKIWYQPTGILYLTATEARYSLLEHKWTDTATSKIEESLPSILEAFIEIAAQKKLILHKDKLEREESAVRMRKAEMREKKRRQEQEIISRIWTEAEAWEKSNRLREYIEAKKQSESQRNQSTEPTEAFRLWCEWAEKAVERIDPLSDERTNDWILRM